VQAEANAMLSCLMHQQACCSQWLWYYMYVQQKVYIHVKINPPNKMAACLLLELLVQTWQHFITSGQSNLTEGCIATAYEQYSLYFTMCHTSPTELPLPVGDVDPHLIHGSLGRPESTVQRASWSVQPFLHGSRSWQTNRPRYIGNNRPHLCA